MAETPLPAPDPDTDAPTSVTEVVDAQERHCCCQCGMRFSPRQENQAHCSRRCYDRWYNRRRPAVRTHPELRQRPLDFAPPPAPLPPVQDQRVPIPDCEGLKGENAEVLARLREGPATTRQLLDAAPTSMAIHSRVSDVRRHLEKQGETVARERLGRRLHRYHIEDKR